MITYQTITHCTGAKICVCPNSFGVNVAIKRKGESWQAYCS